jgi:hypothetical protein
MYLMDRSAIVRARGAVALFLFFSAACSDETAPGASGAVGSGGSIGTAGTNQSAGGGGGGTGGMTGMTDAASGSDASGGGGDGIAGDGGAADANRMPATTYKETWASVDTHPPAPEWFQDAKFGLWYH